MDISNEFQVRWASHTRRRLAPGTPLDEKAFLQFCDEEYKFSLLEEKWIRNEIGLVSERAASAPSTVDGFVRWFEDLKETGPGQNHSLFPWLRDTATRDQIRWFLKQEIAGEAGFEDLVALTQIKLPTQPKLEMARNYWDEMGRGAEKGMHGPLLTRLAQEFDLSNIQDEEVVSEALALSNLMVSLAWNRRYTYHSVGALGAIELTAPWRASKVYDGLKRVGVSASNRHYFLLHSTIDVKHSEAWNKEILIPLISAQPEVAHFIAEGALLRLEMGHRCFNRYQNEYEKFEKASLISSLGLTKGESEIEGDLGKVK